MLNSVKKLQIFYAKSPEINLAPSPAEQAVHGVLFTFNWRTFGYRLLLVPWCAFCEDMIGQKEIAERELLCYCL